MRKQYKTERLAIYQSLKSVNLPEGFAPCV
jgi:hypothetical protein